MRLPNSHSWHARREADLHGTLPSPSRKPLSCGNKTGAPVRPGIARTSGSAMTARYALVVNMAKKNPLVFIPVDLAKVGQAHLRHGKSHGKESRGSGSRWQGLTESGETRGQVGHSARFESSGIERRHAHDPGGLQCQSHSVIYEDEPLGFGKGRPMCESEGRAGHRN
jgi:hypothetical protein